MNQISILGIAIQHSFQSKIIYIDYSKPGIIILYKYAYYKLRILGFNNLNLEGLESNNLTFRNKNITFSILDIFTLINLLNRKVANNELN